MNIREQLGFADQYLARTADIAEPHEVTIYEFGSIGLRYVASSASEALDLRDRLALNLHGKPTCNNFPLGDGRTLADAYIFDPYVRLVVVEQAAVPA